MNFLALKYNCIMEYASRYNIRLTLGLLERGAHMTVETKNTEIIPNSKIMDTGSFKKFIMETEEIEVLSISKKFNIKNDCVCIWYGRNFEGFDVMACIPQQSSNIPLIILYQLTASIAGSEAIDSRVKTKKYKSSKEANWEFIRSLPECIGGVSLISNQPIDAMQEKITNLQKNEFIVGRDEFNQYYSPVFECLIPTYRRTVNKEEIIKKSASMNFDISIDQMGNDKTYTVEILKNYCQDNGIYFTTKMKRKELIEKIVEYGNKGKKKIKETETTDKDSEHDSVAQEKPYNNIKLDDESKTQKESKKNR